MSFESFKRPGIDLEKKYSNFRLLIREDEYYLYQRDRFLKVIQELEGKVKSETLRNTLIDFIEIGPNKVSREGGRLVINITRGDIQEIVDDIIGLIPKVETKSEEVGGRDIPDYKKQEVSFPEIKIETDDELVKEQIKQWNAKHGVNLGYFNIKPELFSRNISKLEQVFKRVATEKESDRLMGVYFELVTSGGSRYKEGRRYLDITDEPEEIYTFIVSNTGVGF